MWQANRDKQNSRRMSAALMCAALLHVALFIGIDRYALFPDTSLSSTRSKTTRIQLSLPKVQNEPGNQAPKERSSTSVGEEIDSNLRQPKNQGERVASRAEPAAKEINQKSAEPVGETVHEPA